MEIDKALNSKMEFIAIDMSNFHDINQKQKEDILKFFKGKYGVDVMDATFEELKDKGYYNPNTLALKGVLLRIEKFAITFNKNVTFEGSKFRSGKGSVGVVGTIYFMNGNWKIKELKKIG
ncbi:MAG: peptide ABC transporter substrate-binding protein [Heyndrickxia sp.]